MLITECVISCHIYEQRKKNSLSFHSRYLSHCNTLPLPQFVLLLPVLFVSFFAVCRCRCRCCRCSVWSIYFLFWRNNSISGQTNQMMISGLLQWQICIQNRSVCDLFVTKVFIYRSNQLKEKKKTNNFCASQ